MLQYLDPFSLVALLLLVVCCLYGDYCSFMDLQPSNHRLFAITGPFYNPGPYSGYLAMIFPINLGCLLQSMGKTRYLWLVAFALMLCILPAGMSRSAWLALSFSSLWVLVIHFKWITKAKSYLQTHFYTATLLYITVAIIIVCASVLLYQMKADRLMADYLYGRRRVK